MNGSKLSNISGRIPLHSPGFIHKEETLKATKNGNCCVWPDTGQAVAMNPALTNKGCSGDACTTLGKGSIEVEGGPHKSTGTGSTIVVKVEGTESSPFLSQ